MKHKRGLLPTRIVGYICTGIVVALFASCAVGCGNSDDTVTSISTDTSNVSETATSEAEIQDYLDQVVELGKIMDMAEAPLRECFSAEGEPEYGAESQTIIQQSAAVVEAALDEWRRYPAQGAVVDTVHQNILEYMELFDESLEHLETGFAEEDMSEVVQWAEIMKEAHVARDAAFAEVEALIQE